MEKDLGPENFDGANLGEQISTPFSSFSIRHLRIRKKMQQAVIGESNKAMGGTQSKKTISRGTH